MTLDELKERLDDEFQDIYKCILINGDWGIGKTFFLKEKFLKDKDYIDVSVFGAKSIEAIKAEIYSKINTKCKIIEKARNWIREFEGNSIGIGVISLPIACWEADINEAISRNTKDKTLTIVIDDLERKSKEINISDILGMIESISQINNVNIIVVANEKKIKKEDLETYDNFKEKVIQKVYNVDKYSSEAPKDVTKKLLKNIKISKEHCLIIENTILDVFGQHSINNLRTLEKACKFIKLIIKHIDFNELSEKELKDIITATVAVVIEETEKLYISLEIEKRKKEKNKTEKALYNDIWQAMIEERGDALEYCIVKNYFKEQFLVSNKITVVRSILSIYRDKDVKQNFYKINKFYKDLHTIEKKEEEKHLFYLSGEELVKRVENFYNNYVLKIDKSIDINNWFKKLNEVYHYSAIVGMQSIFNDEKVLIAMDGYLKRIEIDNGLFHLLDRHIMYEIEDEKMKYYNNELKRKTIEKYYNKCFEKLKFQTDNGIYETKMLEAVFSIYGEEKIEFNKKSIIDKLEENKFFIPNLNNELTENVWGFTHSIWEKAKRYKMCRDRKFEKCIQEILENSTAVGKYRIESLNSQYQITLNEDKQ